jgi:hypothetical protein
MRHATRYLRYECDEILLTKLPKEVTLSKKTQKRRYSQLYGCYNYDSEQESIKIDYRFDIVPTIIHEILHAMHPKWTERKVRKEENRHLRSLSEKQVINLLRTYINCLTSR